jgi:hypothetical protein
MAPHFPLRRPRRAIRSVALLASVSALGFAGVGMTAPPASASLLSTVVSNLIPSCAAVHTTTAFTAWNDKSSYFMMPGGAFEAGAPGWTTAGATVVSGNESSFVNAKGDAHSLAMPTASLAISPTACVAMGENTIRLFVKNPGVAGSDLHIQAFVQNPLTGLVLATGFDIPGKAGSAGWAPTSPLLIPNLLGGVLGTQNLTLVFSTTGKPATWNVDDVYVDPFKMR